MPHRDDQNQDYGGLRVRLAQDHQQFDQSIQGKMPTQLSATAVSPFCKSFAFLCHVRCLQRGDPTDAGNDNYNPNNYFERTGNNPGPKPQNQQREGFAGRGELNRCSHVPASNEVHVLCICNNGVDLTAEVDYALEGIVDIAATGDSSSNNNNNNDNEPTQDDVAKGNGAAGVSDDPAEGAPIYAIRHRHSTTVKTDISSPTLTPDYSSSPSPSPTDVTIFDTSSPTSTADSSPSLSASPSLSLSPSPSPTGVSDINTPSPTASVDSYPSPSPTETTDVDTSSPTPTIGVDPVPSTLTSLHLPDPTPPASAEASEAVAQEPKNQNAEKQGSGNDEASGLTNSTKGGGSDADDEEKSGEDDDDSGIKNANSDKKTPQQVLKKQKKQKSTLKSKQKQKQKQDAKAKDGPSQQAKQKKRDIRVDSDIVGAPDPIDAAVAATSDQTPPQQWIDECSASPPSNYDQYKRPPLGGLVNLSPETYCSAFISICPKACQVLLHNSSAIQNGNGGESHDARSWSALCSWDGPLEQEVLFHLKCHCGSTALLPHGNDSLSTCVATRMIEVTVAAAVEAQRQQQPPNQHQQKQGHGQGQGQQTALDADGTTPQSSSSLSFAASMSGSLSANGLVDQDDDDSNGGQQQHIGPEAAATATCLRFVAICDAACHAIIDTSSSSPSSMSSNDSNDNDGDGRSQPESSKKKRRRRQLLSNPDSYPSSSHRHRRRSVDPQSHQQKHHHHHHRHHRRHLNHHDKRKLWTFPDFNIDSSLNHLQDNQKLEKEVVKVTCDPHQLQARQCLCQAAAVGGQEGLVIDLTKTIFAVVV
ncbi:hypothetical protein DFQ27_001754 [Actinomortierella ambigua]|uniref:Uncharacterized protein n=1 Tax=Actinomortierella ambigua TaxID=1343610 RepID=A0A9P6QBH6_9FUNG|nr:hypothetical protein DFQ27_001754 [Actinomortierella ambigua]